MNSYLLEGMDHLSITKEIDKLILKNGFKDATISTYDLEDDLLDSALEDLDTYSFLSEKKVIIINNFDKLKSDETTNQIKHLIQYIKNPMPTNMLFITSCKLDDRKKIVKDLKKELTYTKVELDPIKYIKNELNDYTLDIGVVVLINELCKGDITKITNECLKLKNYKIKEKKITKEDVNTLVVKKLGDNNEIIFSFVRALAEKDKSRALKLYNELLDYQFEPLSIIALLESQFRIMYQVKILEKDRLSNDEIAKMLKERSSYRISKTKELTRFYSENELLKLMIKLADIDLKIKTTSSDSNLLIQLFILNL